MRRAPGVTMLLAALALSVAASATASARQADPETLRLLLSRAEALLNAGDPGGALDVLDRLLGRAEGIDASSPEALRLLLRKSLETRIAARWATDDRNGLDADLDRLVRLDPAYDLSATHPDEGLLGRFNRRRDRLVGYLTIGIYPADAELTLDGAPLEHVGEVVAVLAGDHVVGATRRGFAAQQAEVSVRANRTEGVGLTLERSSATVQVATDPAGASVTLDAEFIGTTVAAAEGTQSVPLVVEGLLPGWHEIEITLTDHRPFRQRFEVPGLMDYDLGTLTMRLALGSVTLRQVPEAAELWVDGARVDTVRSGPESVRLQLPVGDHDLLIGADGGRVWSGRVSVVDGGTAARDVALAPGLAFLGVTGGDALDRESAGAPILRALQELSGWTVLDRSRTADQVGADEILRLGDGAGQQLRRDAEEAIPAGLFVVGTLDPGDRGSVVVRVWAAGAPLDAVRLDIAQGDPESLRAALHDLTTPLPPARAWHGLVLADTSRGPMVAAVTPDSPAAAAGFAPGDRLVTLAEGGAGTAQTFRDWADAAGPHTSVAIGIERGGTAQNLQLVLDASPQVAAAPTPATAISWWARAAAGIGAGGGIQPIWALHLQQALLLIQAHRTDAAVDMLWNAAAPADPPFGKASVDYWLGVTLSMADEPDLSAARNALNRAAGVPGARLFHNDGPLIGPRARARIARIAAQMDR